MKAGPVAGQALEGAWYVPVDVGLIEDLGFVLATIMIIAVIAVIVIPLLLFGIELIIVSLVTAVGIVTRSVFGRPWIVLAVPSANPSDALRWRVKGWRRSAQLMNEVATELADGLMPSPVRDLTLRHTNSR